MHKKKLHHAVIEGLWNYFCSYSTQIKILEKKLKQIDISRPLLDHFALIDLPGPHSGIKILETIFSYLGFTTQGHGYLADKQNDFLWMCDKDAFNMQAHAALPQVVIADFRLDEMPPKIQNIILKYASLTEPFPLKILEKPPQTLSDDNHKQLQNLILKYFRGRDWPLPQYDEYKAIEEFNELLAWVLLFGRRPNHFTIAIHLLNKFDNLQNFLEFLGNTLPLNTSGNLIKGGEEQGIAQAATRGIKQKILLENNEIEVVLDFIEFVWRYPCNSALKKCLWSDFYTGFIPQQANRVIQSLYK